MQNIDWRKNMSITWIKPVNVRISKDDDVRLRQIASKLKLNNPVYNQSAVIRRCIIETFERIGADGK